MVQIIEKIKDKLLYPKAKTVVNFQSFLKRIQTLNSKTVIVENNSYDDRPILFIALYQYGTLRQDIVFLLEEARSRGFYIYGINTLKLDKNDLKYFDTYIGRPNFGRDFGSYKKGFLHLFKKEQLKNCPRLLMLNDSIIYVKQGLSKFLNDLVNTDIEVLGATENFEIEPHLGSFCISFDNKILNHKRFQRYWLKYKLTDVRPKVIKKGEMKLSKVLKKCVSSPRNFASLYNITRFFNEININDNIIDFFMKHHRTSTLVHWPKFERSEVLKEISSYVTRYTDTSELKVEITGDISNMNESVSTYTLSELVEYTGRFIKDPDSKNTIGKLVRQIIAGQALDVFRCGSQIHQNQSILLKMGLPIIKMDCLYRGMFNMQDILTLTNQLPEEDSKLVFGELTKRQFGADTLIGWKRAAFMVGLI